MTEAYLLKWFLLHAKQEFLHEFFRRQNLLLNVPFALLDDGQADLVFAAMQAIGPDHREASEACFQDIYQMANRAGFDAIIAASRSNQLKLADEDLVQRLGRMAGYLDRAFWTFLHRPQYWDFACLLAGADAISSAAWEKHPRVPRVTPRIEHGALEKFAGALGHYFHIMEGRGHRCDVKVGDRGDLLYIFCLLEQPSRADPEWRPEGLRRRTHKPAQPLTFMYCQATGELDTYLRAKQRVVWDVTAIFAQHVLGVKKLEPPPRGRGVYRPIASSNVARRTVTGQRVASQRLLCAGFASPPSLGRSATSYWKRTPSAGTSLSTTPWKLICHLCRSKTST